MAQTKESSIWKAALERRCCAQYSELCYFAFGSIPSLCVTRSCPLSSFIDPMLFLSLVPHTCSIAVFGPWVLLSLFLLDSCRLVRDGIGLWRGSDISITGCFINVSYAPFLLDTARSQAKHLAHARSEKKSTQMTEWFQKQSDNSDPPFAPFPPVCHVLYTNLRWSSYDHVRDVC